MSIQTYIKTNTTSLAGKKVCITGATGGLGRELCLYLASLGASLVLVNRSESKAKALEAEITEKYPMTPITHVLCDLVDMDDVRLAAAEIRKAGIDALIHNAGAYAIPRYKCKTGFGNVFQIDFLSPYYLTRELLPDLKTRPGARVIAVGSVAHNYSKTDDSDIDFSKRTASSKVYGNAKRYLMYSMYELFRDKNEVGDVRLAIVHPGITFTNITAHYPPWLFAIIKYPMKIIFPRVKKAALSILRGMFEDCGYHEWIGPRIFDVWGYPKKRRLRTVSEEESRKIGDTASKIYENLLK